MNELAFMEYLPQILVFVGICVMLIGLVSVADPSKKLINRMSGKFTGTEKKAVNIRSGSKDTMVTKIAQVVTPKKGEKRTALREKLIRAGYRDSSTVFKYYLLRAVLAIVGLACVALFVSELSFNNMLMLGAGLALFGFSIPSYVLSKKVKARRLTIMHAFPDALDMLLICVESGLGIDSSLAKVSAELKDAHPALSEELLITCAELRAGKSRSKSLTDLATRLDVDDPAAAQLQRMPSACSWTATTLRLPNAFSISTLACCLSFTSCTLADPDPPRNLKTLGKSVSFTHC